MRVRLLLTLLPLCLFVLVAQGCHPSGIIWTSLKPSAPQKEVGFTYCDSSMPQEIYEVEDGLFRWQGVLSMASGGGMDIWFNGPHPCSFNPNPHIYIGYDEDNKTCKGKLTCILIEAFHPPDHPEREIVGIYFSRYWLNEPPGRRMHWTLRQVGEALGLGLHAHTSCLPDPHSGQDTVMSHPVSGCPAFEGPQVADAMGLACNIYGYTCSPNPQMAGAELAGAAAATPDDGPDHDIDGLADVYDDDDDNDGFSDADEAYMGTDALDNCPDSSQDDAWPPDFDMNRFINVTDVDMVLPPFFGSSTGQPNYSPRRDLAPNGVINVTDVDMVLPPTFGQSCVSTQSQIVDVIKATERYRDVLVAEDEGFLQATQYTPHRGAYFIKPDRWDDTLNLMEPEGLLYQPVAGGWRLVGVFYFDPSWLAPNPPQGFIGGGDVWITHYGFCIDANLQVSEAVSEGECGAAGGIWWEEFGHLLVAWLFGFNPDGVFREVNPNVD